MIKTSTNTKQLALMMGVMLILAFITNPSFASATAGSGMPYEAWLTKLVNSISGPYAYAVSIIGLVATGSALIFGGDLNGVMRAIIYIVMVLSLIIGAKAFISSATGTGAQLSAPTHPSVINRTK